MVFREGQGAVSQSGRPSDGERGSSVQASSCVDGLVVWRKALRALVYARVRGVNELAAEEARHDFELAVLQEGEVLNARRSQTVRIITADAGT